METFTKYSYVWIPTIILLSVFMVFVIRMLIRNRRVQKEIKKDIEINLDKYERFTLDKFMETPEDKLLNAVLYHLIRKEENHFENRKDNNDLFINHLTHGQKLIFSIYKIDYSLQSKPRTIKSFFYDEEYEPYSPYVSEAFHSIDCQSLSEILDSLSTYVDNLKNNREDQDDSKYATYNFSDYTDEFYSMFQMANLDIKAGKYIAANRKDFIEEGEENE